MHIRILKLSAALAIIAATPTVASARSVVYGTSPVAITSCSVNESYDPGMELDSALGMNLGSAPQLVPSSVALTFVNTSEVPATTVAVSVTDGHSMLSIVDKGSFRPGAQIKHDFALGSGTSTLSDVRCKVAEVDFADGTAWHVADGDTAAR